MPRSKLSGCKKEIRWDFRDCSDGKQVRQQANLNGHDEGQLKGGRDRKMTADLRNLSGWQ